jgi:putative aldouronate transport system substrate-binding protein
MKVKNSNIKYKGQSIIPLLGHNYNNPIYVAFGLDLKEDANGNYLLDWENPKYLEAYKFYNKLTAAGLVYRDEYTSQEDQQKEMVMTGRVFMMNVNISNFTQTLEDLHNLDTSIDYVAVEMPRPSDGSDPAFGSTGAGGWLGTGISKNCKNPDRAMRLLAFLNSPGNMESAFYGVKGKVWNMVDGHVKYTAEYLDTVAKGPAAVTAKYGDPYAICAADPAYLTEKIAPLEMLPAAKRRLGFQKFFSKYVFNEMCFTGMDPTDPDLLAIRAKCQDIMGKAEPKMALAASEQKIEEIYKQAIEQCKQAGMQKLDDFYNNAFQANKKKLGVKFVYPPRNK